MSFPKFHKRLTWRFPMAVFWCMLLLCCNNSDKTNKSVYKYIKPDYDLVQLHVTSDTLHFALPEEMNNNIKSFNVFSSDTTALISFYDQLSQTISIYNLKSFALLKTLSLKSIFKGRQLYKTTVYCKNLDSIFITNKTSLYLLDDRGKIKKLAEFLEDPPLAWAAFDNTNPPLFKGPYLYMYVRPYVKEASISALKDWKTIYRFDLKNKKAVLLYNLPMTYQRSIYGYHFLDYSYCINPSGNFVFSFPADTNIYECDLANYHMAYYAKSKLQISNIQPIDKSLLNDNEYKLKSYLLRDSYGPVYFDPTTKRYLRVAKRRITDTDYSAGNRKKEQRIIIFNEQFRIIGESTVNRDILLNTIIFTCDGGMYARVKPSDEYALHFIRLTYDSITDPPIRLAKK